MRGAYHNNEHNSYNVRGSGMANIGMDFSSRGFTGKTIGHYVIGDDGMPKLIIYRYEDENGRDLSAPQSNNF